MLHFFAISWSLFWIEMDGYKRGTLTFSSWMFFLAIFAIELCRSAQLHQFTVTLNLLLTKSIHSPDPPFFSQYGCISRERGLNDEKTFYEFSKCFQLIYYTHLPQPFLAGSRIIVCVEAQSLEARKAHLLLATSHFLFLFINNQSSIFLFLFIILIS